MDQDRIEKLTQAISDLIKPAFGSLEQDEKLAVLRAVGKNVGVNLEEEVYTPDPRVHHFAYDDGYIG